MGAYISSLWNPDLPTDIVVDFDRIESPSGAELELYKAASELLEHARTVVSVVQGYQGCGDLIREATRNPHDEAIQIQTFEGMFPNVERIKSFWLLSKDIDDIVVRLVKNFIDTRTFTPALLKVFASLLDVMLRFDREKMMHPEIQNDFSQYRRALQRNQRIPGVPLNDIEANNVSMFVAPASPLINSLSSALDNLQRQGKDVAVFLADFAHICCAFVMRDKSQNKEHAMLTLTAMVVSFILYDSISPVGVFGKGSHIDVKTCVGQLKAITDPHNRGILCDTLHYSTRSYDKAPESIRRIIETR